MAKVALIIVAASSKQNECIWPSYFNTLTGIDHDLIVVHRNMANVPSLNNSTGKIILENKIFTHGELPHKAFGAYREYYNKYKNNYDIFGFISDDVIIKSDGWLNKAVDLLYKFDKLGFIGTQIFNGSNNEYPHSSHCRSPAWFAKSNALGNINWKFESDHEGEMLIADQFVEAGFFGAQVGNKIDIAYDSVENGGYFPGDHISSIFETYVGGNIKEKLNKDKIDNINKMLINKLLNKENDMEINSPHQHISKRKIISQLQPFNGLVYDRSLNIANNYFNEYHFNINILKGCI